VSDADDADWPPHYTERRTKTRYLTERDHERRAKTTRLAVLAGQIRNDPAWDHLRAAGANLVPGAGNPDARIALVGEAPGAQEDAQGVPFVGRAGKLLDHLIEGAGFNRADLWVTNVLKYRPPGNRTPLVAEVDAAVGPLLAELEVVRPHLVVLLGSTAMSALFPKIRPVKLRGHITVFRSRTESRFQALCTYHPSAVARDPALLPVAQQHFQTLRAAGAEDGRALPDDRRDA
jgi:uracil-DNA glycosylase family 4